MKVAVRVDASARMGTGHLARSLTLANTLQARGADIRFVSRALQAFLAEQITSQGHDLMILAPPLAPLAGDEMDLMHSNWLGVSQSQDAAESTAALPGYFDLLIVDHYGLDHRWERALRQKAGVIFVIDDLADRVHDCDMLLDQNLQSKEPNRYSRLVPPSCQVLLGPAYAMLRPEFLTLRSEAARDHNRLNVFLGGTDPQGGTLLAIEAIAPLCRQGLRADVVLGAGNPHLEVIRARCESLSSITLYVQVGNMAELFAAAGLAVGAGGSAGLERCSQGLPQLLTSFADNQRASCEAFSHAGAAVDLGPMANLTAIDLRDTIATLVSQPERLAKMGAAGRALVDGKGAERVLKYVFEATGAPA